VRRQPDHRPPLIDHQIVIAAPLSESAVRTWGLAADRRDKYSHFLMSASEQTNKK